MRTFRNLKFVVLTVLCCIPATSMAAFHRLHILEVFPGMPGNPDAQYVVLRADVANQNRVTNHGIQVFDSAGMLLSDHKFASDVSDASNQMHVLIATAEAEGLFGVEADLTMLPNIQLQGGKVCFDNIDCVTWGDYSGSSTDPAASGTPFNAAQGLVSGRPLRRDISANVPTTLTAADDTGDSDGDFYFSAVPFPINNAAQAGFLPMMAVLGGSANPGGSTDFAVLAADASTNDYVASVVDGLSGETLRKINFGATFRPLYFTSTPDTDSNGADELVMVGRDSSTGTVRAEVRDSASGARRALSIFEESFLPAGFAVIPDINGSGANELVYLGQRPTDGLVRAEIKDISSGSRIKLSSYGVPVRPSDVSWINDINMNNAPELVVVGINGQTGLVQGETRDTGQPSRTALYGFASQFLPISSSPLADMNANSADEVALLGLELATGEYRAEIKDGSTQARIGLASFGNSYSPFSFGHVADVGGGNNAKLFVVGTDASSGQIRAELKAPISGARVRLINFASAYSGVDAQVINDLNNNNSEEIIMLSRQVDGGRARVEVRDSLTGSRLLFIPIN